MKFRALGFAMAESEIKRVREELPALLGEEEAESAKRKLLPQGDFLELISSRLRAKKEVQQENSTFFVKPINPNKIKSLTERAFFKAFNPGRAVLDDQQSQKDEGAPKVEIVYKSEIVTSLPKDSVIYIQKAKAENSDANYCICEGKNQCLNWICCDSNQKCKGKRWYHMSCIGIKEKDMEDEIWMCPQCLKEEGKEDKEDKEAPK